MAYKRNHLLFVKADTDDTIAKAAAYAADRFKGVVISSADKAKANFKSTDGDEDAAVVELHMKTSCAVDFKNFCMMFAGALAGHSLQPGTCVTVADDVNEQYLHGAALSDGDAVTEITL